MPDVDLRRTRNFSDIIHGTIQYNAFEEIILQTPLLMRLQRISQNSLAFITFPSNKVKRFEHSLGVMHLASKLLRAALTNTDANTLSLFFAGLKTELINWAKKDAKKRNPPLSKYREDCFGLNGKLNVQKFFTLDRDILCGNSFFDSLIPSNIPAEHYILCSCLFQGVRLAGLLHDVGHLPYSHTVEAIINSLTKELNEKACRSALEEKYLELSNSYMSKQALHEALSQAMFPVVEEEVADKLTKLEEKDPNAPYTLILIFAFRIAYSLLYLNDTMIYKSLHSIVSGVIDVDRLDYASRDLFCSAVSKDIINYERFFLYHSFRQNDECIHIVPEVKSIHEIEEFLRRRWRIFRDINYHHSVHKSELIMRRVLISRALKKLESTDLIFDNIVEEFANELPRDFILGIMLILEHVNADGDQKSLRKFLLMLDDAWLDTLLKKSDDAKSDENELIYGRKVYKTVIKRYSDFYDFDRAVFEKISSLANEIKALISDLPCDGTEGEENLFIDDISDLLDNVKYCEDHDAYILNFGSYGLFTNQLLGILDILFAIEPDLENVTPLEMFEKRIYSSDLYGQEELFLGAIDFSIGIKPDSTYDIWVPKKSTMADIKKYSSIHLDLQREKELLPSFHLYAKNDIDENACLEKLSNLFCEMSCSVITTYLKKCFKSTS